MTVKKSFRQAGTSLLEILVSTAIFAVISVALMIIFNIGLKNWKDMDAKSESEQGLSRAVSDINYHLKNSDYNNVICSAHNSSCKGGAFVVCPSAACYGKPGQIGIEGATFSSGISKAATDTAISGSGILEQEIDATPEGSVNWHHRIVYFVAKKNEAGGCDECMRLFGSSEYCPHKILVKRWYRLDNFASNAENWKSVENNYLANAVYVPQVYEKKLYDKILAKNVFAFKAEKQSGGAVYFALKSFRHDKKGVRMEIDDFKRSIDLFNYEGAYTNYAPSKNIVDTETNKRFYKLNSVEDPASFTGKCMIQMDSLVVPMNTTAP